MTDDTQKQRIVLFVVHYPLPTHLGFISHPHIELLINC